MLRMHSELDYLTAHLPELRCGPKSGLRSCTLEDTAIIQQSEQCSGSTHEALLSIYQHSHCDDALRMFPVP
jgi:hypothetical protein